MQVGSLRHRTKNAVKDVAIRAGARSYRPMQWSSDRWEGSFSRHDTDSFGDANESARYGVLTGYLATIGGSPTLLDLGCGAGVLRSRLSREYFGTYLGVDPTEAAIAQAKEFSDDVTAFKVADIMSQDVGLFDVVVCNEVLYFADDPFALADKAISLLRPGGSLLTSIWRHPGDRKLWQHIDAKAGLVDRVWVRNESNRIAARGWQIGWHRPT